MLPPGHRSPQVLRAFFCRRVGPDSRFDATKRAFVAAGEGRTLGQAVEHWYATRTAGPGEIPAQFEMSRFARAGHQAHPGGTRAELLTACRSYRILPVEARPDP